MIDTSSEENIQDSEMTQVENKEVVNWNKTKKLSDWSDKTLRTYKDKEKIEDKFETISTFANESVINVDTALEVNGECGIISKFTVKEKKNTEECKIKGMISMIFQKRKRNVLVGRDNCTLEMEDMNISLSVWIIIW